MILPDGTGRTFQIKLRLDEGIELALC